MMTELTQDMETINGFTVIAEKPTRDGDRIILCAQRFDGETRYVVARAKPAPVTWWHAGDYCERHGTAHNFAEAVAIWMDREH